MINQNLFLAEQMVVTSIIVWRTALSELRRDRIRRLVSKLNKSRKSQMKKIDILCNDMVASHGKFISSLRDFRFAADFYESLIGISSVEELSDSTADFFISHTPGANVAIVFADSEYHRLHFYGSNPVLEDICEMLNNSLTAGLAREVCRSNKICAAQELFAMGLVASPAMMKKISIAAVGFSNSVSAKGMVVLYRDSALPLKPEELNRVASVMRGFAKAVRHCQGKASYESIL